MGRMLYTTSSYSVALLFFDKASCQPLFRSNSKSSVSLHLRVDCILIYGLTYARMMSIRLPRARVGSTLAVSRFTE